MREIYAQIVGLPLCCLLSACGILGGPSDSEVEEIARQEMVKNAGNTPMKIAAETAEISKRGLCNSQPVPGAYVCMVDVTLTMPGQSSESKLQTKIVKLKEGPAGDWVAAD